MSTATARVGLASWSSSLIRSRFCGASLWIRSLTWRRRLLPKQERSQPSAAHKQVGTGNSSTSWFSRTFEVDPCLHCDNASPLRHDAVALTVTELGIVVDLRRDRRVHALCGTGDPLLCLFPEPRHSPARIASVVIGVLGAHRYYGRLPGDYRGHRTPGSKVSSSRVATCLSAAPAIARRGAVCLSVSFTVFGRAA